MIKKEPLYKTIAWRIFMCLIWFFVVVYVVTNFVNWLRAFQTARSTTGRDVAPHIIGCTLAFRVT
jgi:hypothetical protein